MGYPNRRYRVVDGKLAKRWDGTNDPEWFVTKVEAWAAEEARLKNAADAKPPPFGDWRPDPPPPPPPPPTPETETADYATWKGPKLRSEIKARTGKGPKVGAESTMAAMIERLRDIDAQRGGFEEKIGEAYAEVQKSKSDGKPVVIPPAKTDKAGWKAAEPEMGPMLRGEDDEGQAEAEADLAADAADPEAEAVKEEVVGGD